MEVNRVLTFDIKGKIAHFKKYYSNKSSLTYKIPTRTVLMGLVASILKYCRDSYYDKLSPDKAKFGLEIIKPGIPHFECMNYLKKDGGHTQVRLQILLPQKDQLNYRIYFAHKDQNLVKKLSKKIKNKRLGYGLYLGQRQFRASVEFNEIYENVEIINNFTGELQTLTYKENIKNIETNNNCELTVDNMPISFKKVKSGREPEDIRKICFEENGNGIKGDFKEVLNLKNKNISFYTPI